MLLRATETSSVLWSIQTWHYMISHCSLRGFNKSDCSSVSNREEFMLESCREGCERRVRILDPSLGNGVWSASAASSAADVSRSSGWEYLLLHGTGVTDHSLHSFSSPHSTSARQNSVWTCSDYICPLVLIKHAYFSYGLIFSHGCLSKLSSCCLMFKKTDWILEAQK